MPRLIIMPRRREPEDYVYDIEKIAENVRRKDPGIEVIVHWAETEALSAGIPKASLIVCLRQLDAPLAVPGRVMACAAISKVDQERAYRNNWIPTPPAVPFQWGLALDPKQWGAFVVIKPLSPDLTSFGGALWCPTTLLPNLRPDHFAPNHPIRDNAFLVQSFIDTGRYPRHYRVLCFLGVPLHELWPMWFDADGKLISREPLARPKPLLLARRQPQPISSRGYGSRTTGHAA